jgi:hypothetical protein
MNHVIAMPPTMNMTGGHQARPLQTAEAHDRMPAGATTGVARAEAHHKTADHQEDETAQVKS